MSCKYCTEVNWATEEARCYEPYAFGSYRATLLRSEEEFDGRRWILEIEDTDTSLFCTGTAGIPVEHCPWCGSRLDSDRR